ncbi:MAG: universal stress protein [Steroidobacteraceae bacterium]
MEKLASIMVVAERNGGDVALRKACILARHFGSKIELFNCDAEHAYELGHLYDRRGAEGARQTCLADARRYLQTLRSSVAADDIAIDIKVACESPAYEGIVRHARDTAPNLVVRDAGDIGGRGTARDTTNWHLIRTCPAPLLLTRGRSWHAVPRFAATVDVSDDQPPGLARLIAHTAAYLQLGCGATLDLVYSELHGADAAASACRALQGLAREFRVEPERIHRLQGAPEVTLPRFLTDQDYDVLFLGALTHRKGYTTLVGSLTERLLERLACDLVVIKPSPISPQLLERPPRVAAP